MFAEHNLIFINFELLNAEGSGDAAFTVFECNQ